VRILIGIIQIVALFIGTGVVSAQSLPSPWVSADIGAPTLAGSATQSSGVFTIDAAGIDIWGTSDQFRFVYQQVSGDVDIVAKVQDVTDSHAWAKAGVMIRASLAANSPHAFALVSAGKGVHLQSRASAGAQSLSTAASTSGAPAWVRTVRSGNKVTAYWSTTGTSWTTIGSVTLPLNASAYVGIAVTSHNAGARTTAKVSNVAVTRTALPQGQLTRDIGAPAVAGSASYSSSAYTVKGAGTDIWSAADQFRFVYQPMTGNAEVVARVASLTNVNAWSKAGVMIREALTAESRHASMFASPSKGYAFQRRPETGALSEHTSGGSGTAPGWVRLVRSGDLFEAYRSADGVSWTRVGSDTIQMASTVYVGLAVTSHDPSRTATAVFDHVKIAGSTQSSNRAPAVSVTAPTNGTKYTLPATVAIAATATDPEGRMASVDFYAGSTLIKRDTTAPYSASWAPSAAGTYSLTAVAHDADGGSTTSGAVSITVQTATTTTPPRLVAFTASADHAMVTSYRLEVFASGANPSTATPVATSNLGKPTPATNGDITVDRATFFSGLAPGNYIATVSAIGSAGSTRSTGVTFTR
jgi:regulation of enolase protein 1 (concanavalin A-like superfamily)